jgi:AbrB family looped-hinge helix DNA binding protein
MKTTIDSAGRIVIPRDIRNATGLGPGTVVEVAAHDGVVSIQPAAVAVKIVKKGGLHVAVAGDARGELTEDEVRAVRDEVRRDR